jgi:hypothetical protein
MSLTTTTSFTSRFLTPEESDRALAIVNNADDSFRVVIRGSALIEDQLKKVINAGFRDGTPAELKGLRIPAQLALAEALGLVTPDVVNAITALRRIRHRLAHGSNEEVTKDDVRTLLKAFEQIFRDVAPDRERSEADQLRFVVYGIWHATGSDAEYALQKRAEADEALLSKRLKGLPPEVIRGLLQTEGAVDREDSGSTTRRSEGDPGVA